MSKLTSRLERMEAKRGDCAQRAARIAEDAELFRQKLAAMAAGFDDSDANLTMDAWAATSPAFRVAWAMRFCDWPMDYAISKLVLQDRGEAIG